MLVCMFYAASYATTRVPPEFLPYIYVSKRLLWSRRCGDVRHELCRDLGPRKLSDVEVHIHQPSRISSLFLWPRPRPRVGRIGRRASSPYSRALSIPQVRHALNIAEFDPLWLLIYLAIGGWVMLWSGGMILASAMLNLSRSGMFLSEGIAGVVYFLSGVVFPISVLPRALQYIGLCLPTTYWLEGMRRAITGPPPEGSPLALSPLATWSKPELAGALVGTTILLIIVSQWFYRYKCPSRLAQWPHRRSHWIMIYKIIHHRDKAE